MPCGVPSLSVDDNMGIEMRLGFFTGIDGWGGSEVFLHEMLLGAKAKGHGVVLFGIEGSRLMREMREAGVDCVAWRGARESRPDSSPPQQDSRASILGLGLGSLREAVRLSRIFRQAGVDLVHVNISGYEMAGVACRLARIPCVGFNQILPVDEPWWFRRWLIKATARSYDYVCAPSKSCIDAWRDLAGLSKRTTGYVWFGIDLGRFGGSASSGTGNSDCFRVVSVGRLHPMKGFVDLIRAIGHVKDPSVQLQIIGEGEQRPELQREIERLGLQNRVDLRGHSECVEELLHKADCFALVSVSHESFGLVMAEAMAAGLPAVTSDYGPLPELNQHGITGLVVPAGDAVGIAEAIEKIHDSVEMRRAMGAAARERAFQCFSSDRMVNEMLDVYMKTAHRE